jgi:hypothetical protein
VSANARGGVHSRCSMMWEACAQRGKASPVAVQQPAQPHQQQKCNPKKGGCR